MLKQMYFVFCPIVAGPAGVKPRQARGFFSARTLPRTPSLILALSLSLSPS